MNSFEHKEKGIYYQNHYIQTYSFGNGENVIFSFPSFPHSGVFYMWFLSKYKGSNFKFITFDLPGWIGYSEDFLSPSKLKNEEYVEIAKVILKEYKVENFSIVGYSFGGSLAIKLASDLKNRIKSVVLVSAIINGKRIPITNSTKYLILSAYYLKLYSKVKSFLIKVFNKIRSEAHPDVPQEVFTMYGDMLTHLDAKVATICAYKLFTSDWTQYLLNIKDLPIMIVNSREEKYFYREQAKYMRRLLNNEKSIYLKGTHDDFILKADSKVVSDVMKFLTK